MHPSTTVVQLRELLVCHRSDLEGLQSKRLFSRVIDLASNSRRLKMFLLARIYCICTRTRGIAVAPAPAPQVLVLDVLPRLRWSPFIG